MSSNPFTTVVVRKPDAPAALTRLREAFELLRPFVIAMNTEGDDMTVLELIEDHEDFQPHIATEARQQAAALAAEYLASSPDHGEVIENRALLQDAEPATASPDCCGQLVFALRDQHHAFSLGLDTLLQCLHFAQQESAIPKLPSEWWIAVTGRYDLDRP